jgi:hypothetical protein
MPSIAQSLGVISEDSMEADGWGIRPTRHVCLIVVDGLGALNLAEFSADAPFLNELATDAATASTGFPSTTATSMSIIGTGSETGRTGIVGYSAMNPATGENANFVAWRNLPAPHEIQREPVLLEKIVRSGLRVRSIGLARYNGSGMTLATLRGPEYEEAISLRDHFERALLHCVSPGLTHLYWADIDKVGHHYGVGSPEWRQALRDFDRELARFVANLPTETQLVLTADHGMINVDLAQRIDVAQHFALARGLRGLGGEPRLTHAYFNSPGAADKALPAWQGTIGEHGVVLTRDQAIDLGLFGEVASHVRDWIGHLIVIAKKRATVIDSETMSPPAIGLRGVHGSLTETEVTVPAVIYVA